MPDNRLGELPWLIDTTTGRPNGVRTERGEEIAIPYLDRATGLVYASGAPLSWGLKRTEAVVKHIGSSSNTGVTYNQSAGLSASTITTTLKLEMETGFSAVRLVLMNRAANAINGNTAVVGVTETNATDTSANAATPVIGGTAYAQLAPAGTLNGWRAKTFSGASSANIGAATTVQQFVLADWAALSHVDRTDGGTRPLLLLRTYRDGAASGNWSFNQAGATARTASAAMRGRTFIAANSFTDAVTTLGNSMSLTTTVQPVFPIVRFNTPVLSVWGIGDSTMQGTAQVPDNISTWGLRACNDISTPQNPVVWANFGAASQTAATALATAKAALAAGCPAPSVLVVEAASVNDPVAPANPTVRDREGQVSLALDVIATAKQYAIPCVVFVPLMPYNSLTLSYDNIRKGTNATLRAIALANGVAWLDLSALGDGASPERWVAKYNDGTGAAGDGIHPDETAFDEVMAPALAAVLRVLAS